MVIEGDNTDETNRILTFFQSKKDEIFTPKDIAKACAVDIHRVRSILSKLSKQNKIERVERGKYRFAEHVKSKMDDKVKRYLSTLEKTCAIAIHELMLTEPLVGKKDKAEIEHQIAYFARILVRSRWELEHGTSEDFDVDEKVFKRARKIHEWSKMVFEKSLAEKKK
ncbi:MAG: type IV toxin-antitoxin system AbiEi family antitoxin domain-containing protein [Thermoplasmata archaeon]|nr:MAG: type IV toxin-antitoxin system AbiEi family antitoxin domain-containing protein [Thermoplasmata archaeon]